MITITASAIQHFTKLLPSAQHHIRFDVKKSGCSGWKYDIQVIEASEPGDFKLEQNDFISYLSRSAQESMAGTVVDCVSKNLGSELVFTNPKAKAHCGCGVSFEKDDSQ